MKRRWYGHPFVIVGLLLILLADLISIPNRPYASSTIRHAVAGFRYPETFGHPYPIVGHPYRTDDGIVWRFRWEIEKGPPRDDPRSIDLNWFMLWPVEYGDEGFYHLTRQTQTLAIHNEGVSAEDQEAVIVALADALEKMPNYNSDDLIEMIRAGIRTRTLPVYAGYYRNTLAALVLLALIICYTFGRPLEWLCEPRLGFRSRRFRRERRSQQGRCTACGYDLSGLTDRAVCPECGAER